MKVKTIDIPLEDSEDRIIYSDKVEQLEDKTIVHLSDGSTVESDIDTTGYRVFDPLSGMEESTAKLLRSFREKPRKSCKRGCRWLTFVDLREDYQIILEKLDLISTFCMDRNLSDKARELEKAIIKTPFFC